jgi:hypothetical protein
VVFRPTQPNDNAAIVALFGMPALFLYTAAVHIGLAIFAFVRIRAVASPPHGERYASMPAQAPPLRSNSTPAANANSLHQPSGANGNDEPIR